jgi:Tetratricopeptide repeat
MIELGRLTATDWLQELRRLSEIFGKRACNFEESASASDIWLASSPFVTLWRLVGVEQGDIIASNDVKRRAMEETVHTRHVVTKRKLLWIGRGQCLLMHYLQWTRHGRLKAGQDDAGRDQGQWTEAEQMDMQVMETRKRVLGEEHLSTLTNIANLASTFWNQGRWTEAEQMDMQVIETKKRVLGEEHPSALTNINSLAFTIKE